MWGIFPYLIFFVILFVLPAMARRRHGREVERRFAQVQKKRKSRLIAIVHRQEPMALLGIPQLRYIDLNTSEDVLNAIRTTPKDTPLELILHTPGGLILPALQVARAVKAHPAPTTVFVPHYAMSGGTLIALAADRICLSPHAVLGPIDPQIGGLPAASIARVVAMKDANAVEDYTLVLADVAEKARAQLQRAASELLAGTVPAQKALALGDLLSSGRWTHDYPIEASEAAGMGLPVTEGVPEDIMSIMALFPDRLQGRDVKFLDIGSWLNPFARRRPPVAPAMAIEPTDAERFPFTGYQPGAGARSFSYGPWNPRDLASQGEPGPGRGQRRDYRG
ncbi:SDH family Clp fold serine proteinase [Parvularcula sp. LCG005]|uniref:SDH family Clp fold serine proteinase n=1 Tax=Parvularcula sp. LCG005 TaxID=3078805 RepID=UPI00294346F4|nr:hypothetical protein [Parvularcula sp. LCG005]WOI53948.1 hypothetical protein RUI03_02840 [Parvularcula sp. LCG005]